MQKGKIDVRTENIFPIIKQFLYSDQEIFLRELVSNAVDATGKLQTLARLGDYKQELEDPRVYVKADKKAGTLTVSDHGIGMTAEEVDKYINQIAFSSAEEFLQKYKDKADAIIGHFGLGFYSSFMVAERVEIISRSSQEGANAVKWSCDGSPEYQIEESDKELVGTDVVLHMAKDAEEYLEDNKINELLDKYCKFLPVEIVFGKKKEWKDGKEEETDEDNIINDTKPAWTKPPAELKDDDYKTFYQQLYPMAEEPLFWIHLNVDYPFNLTGILYFPKIRENIEIQKNKIQLYCNQVFVTDQVENIVPDFLTLLHGVLDSPDIPLNVSRSYLQSDPNVKKISAHITKKVADRLGEIFKEDRKQFEEKWKDLKLFIEYGLISDEKFWERAKDYTLLENTDGKYFTIEEYKKAIESNQTDKDKKVVHLYTTDKEEQFSYIENCRKNGYDVLLMDGQLDQHFLNHLESKLENVSFTRVDADTADNLVRKEEKKESSLKPEQQETLTPVFQSQVSDEKGHFIVAFEELSKNDPPVLITQSEFIRRMKDMQKLGGQGAMYGNIPDSYNLVVNTAHPLVNKIVDDTEKKNAEKLGEINENLKPAEEELEKLRKTLEGKKEDEKSQAEKDELESKEKSARELREKKIGLLKEYGKKNKKVKQLVDLALLSNNMLRGDELDSFVKRSVEMIK